MAKAPVNDTAGSGDIGATMATEYLGQQQQITAVDVEDLKDWQTSMREEAWQFSIAGFFASGSLWLAVERLADDGVSDGLFRFCVIVLFASGIVAWFGLKQLGRRSTKIQRYITMAEKGLPQSAATEETKRK